MDQISIPPVLGLLAGLVALWLTKHFFGAGRGDGSGSSVRDDSDGDCGGD